MYRFSRRGILGLTRKFSSSGSSSESHYETLGLKPSATQAEVKAAYFELSKLYHPDKTKGNEESIDKFRSITEAYEVLGNVDSRRMYDRGMFTDDEFGCKEEGTEDSLQQYERARKKKDMGHSFDAWTKYEYQKLRERRDTFKKYEDEMKHAFDSQTPNQVSGPSVLIILACGVALFLLLEYNKDLNHPSQNKIENRLKKSSEKQS